MFAHMPTSSIFWSCECIRKLFLRERPHFGVPATGHEVNMGFYSNAKYVMLVVLELLPKARVESTMAARIKVLPSLF